RVLFRSARSCSVGIEPHSCHPEQREGSVSRRNVRSLALLGMTDCIEGTAMSLTHRYAATLDEIRDAGLFKAERIITSPQAAEITLEDGRTVLNFCANNYLGLADHPAMIQAAKDALDTHGFGMASVRFICGTQDLHKQLEKTISDFF